MNFLLLSVDHIIAIHDEVLELHELQGMAGDKSLEGALSRVDNRLKYGLIEDIYSLAASYATAISQAHCFNDENKRTAFQVMDIILDLNGINAIWDVEEVGQKIVLLSQSKIDEADLAQWLRRVAVKTHKIF
ncbi:type II toxin-antitoxin system death-on-curing family toxin [Porticoccaceae bacterium]|nr:type II toxin-antitoxin system death-on-curing family toxin [Porticoccaceae bacterium]MDC0010742.1 type II toxin-antitoxin system death-on-curing family toxin [Porticoccaceae bacterium]